MNITFQDFAPQGDKIALLRQQLAGRTLVHALLLTGEAGMGKKTLATLISAALLCERQGSGYDLPCGACPACQSSLLLQHPNQIVLRREVPLTKDGKKDRTAIPVDDVREMIRLCSLFTLDGKNRSVLIFEADQMTAQAQNSLLKTLEEPPKNTFFLLTTAHPEVLLPTVRSRCRQVALSPWREEWIAKVAVKQGVPPERARQAAAEAGGSIGKALTLAGDEAYWQKREEICNRFFGLSRRSDVLRVSASWKDQKAESDLLFTIIEQEVRRMLRCHLAGTTIQLTDTLPEAWVKYARRADLGSFLFLQDRVAQARRQTQFNVNYQAVLEQLLLAFTGERTKWEK